jgi:hypothetical protein
MKTVTEFIELVEVNRIIQGLVKKSGKPADHIDALWKDTEKQLLVKHKFGVTDKYKQIGNLVRAKLGVEPEKEDESPSGEAGEADASPD